MALRPIVRVSLGVAALAAATAVVVLQSPASSATTTLAPAADTYVRATTPSTNYGKAGRTNVGGAPQQRMFLKFKVSGVAGAVTSAKLRLHVDNVSNGGSPSGGTFRIMSSTTWSETAVTWNNQPAIDGATLGSLGPVSRNTWYELDLTAAITGNGTYSIGATSTSDDGAEYDSRETVSTAPQLVLTTGTTPTTPATTNPPTTTAPTTAAPTTTAPAIPPTTTPVRGDAVMVGAGDIADCRYTGDEATAALLDRIAGTVYTVGDNAYPSGTAAEFADCYGPTWGRHKARTKPATGNHEYDQAKASAYFGYFGKAAGDPTKGYYSYDIGAWHAIVINSNCGWISGGCAAGGAQEQWLRADLAAHPNACTIAYWHHPRFTSGSDHVNATEMSAIWQALYDFKADVVLSGHNHNYERFAPQNPSGQADPARGIREFVVGTGGGSHYGFGTIQPNSEVRDSTAYGVLKLTLHAASYDWQFVPVAGQTFTDSGSTACH